MAKVRSCSPLTDGRPGWRRCTKVDDLVDLSFAHAVPVEPSDVLLVEVDITAPSRYGLSRSRPFLRQCADITSQVTIPAVRRRRSATPGRVRGASRIPSARNRGPGAIRGPIRTIREFSGVTGVKSTGRVCGPPAMTCAPDRQADTAGVAEAAASPDVVLARAVARSNVRPQGNGQP